MPPSTGTNATKNSLSERFNGLREAVLQKRPVLRDILEKRGGKSIFDYALDFLDVNSNETVKKRQSEFISVFSQVTREKLGDDVARSVSEQLKKYYFVSTADHHGPICHPYFINSNLVSSIMCSEKHDGVLKDVIVLSCANVSLANSTFPRGILFNSYAKGKIKAHQLGFFPNNSSVRYSRVYQHRPYTLSDVDRMRKQLRDWRLVGEIKAEEATGVERILETVYMREEVLSCQSYSDQITKTNLLLWRKVLNHNHVGNAPDLLYIELEAVVISLLIKHHLFFNTAIHRILFEPACQEEFTAYFEGIEGGFSNQNGWGTWLFWALPHGEKYCKRLVKRGQVLVSEDGTYAVQLTPESLKEAFERKELFPSTQLSLMVLALYYGLKCLGGFCQVNYLTVMKEKYLRMISHWGNQEDVEACVNLQTKELGEDLSIAFVGGAHGELSLATSLDLILYSNEATWPCLVGETKKITFDEALSTMMPEFYRVMYPETRREPDLASITAEDITRLMGLDKKIKACAYI